MPYFTKRKLLYIHIPKCYGTSIEHALQESDTMVLSNDKLAKLKYGVGIQKINTPPQHYSFEEIQNFDIDVEHSFATVRNPYTRVISQWKYQNYNKQVFPYKFVKVLFRDWVCDLYDRHKNGTIKNTRHDWPQTDFIFDENNKLLINEIIKCEGLTSIYNVPLCHLNQSISEEQPKFTLEIKKMICEIYKRDFELLGYPMDL